MMSGIYIHIPFCVQKCHYCDFFSSTALELKEKYLASCKKEINSRKDYLLDHTADTIYFGGGTPSVLTTNEIAQLIEEINSKICLGSETEITIEANPDDLNKSYLKDLKGIGINRLSVGIQSFRDIDLKRMNRRHTVQQAMDCLKNAEAAGFDQISADLIYGLPDFGLKEWKENLNIITRYNVNHLSAYHLSIENGTVFSRWLKTGKIFESKEEESFGQFEILRELAGEHGFEHYEISNFARDKQYSKHNTKYWNGAWYLGIGPSAHSYNETHRQWNVADLNDYIMNADMGSFNIRQEKISPIDRRNELIMTRLRTKWGISKDDWRKEQSVQTWEELLKDADRFIVNGDLVLDEHCLKFEPQSWFRADGIIASLFEVGAL
ncbi:MAG: radical SAM family heme chaperone HemW [Bacteroidales bacterium]|nr:radical SAM family heme chaperone HemW [Bacteroidales bacterium]